MIPMQHITVATMGPDYRLHLTFADGRRGSLDFAPRVARGGVFAPISAAVAGPCIADGGRVLEWLAPDGAVADFCADALRMEVDAVVSEMAAE